MKKLVIYDLPINNTNATNITNSTNKEGLSNHDKSLLVVLSLYLL